MVYKSMICKKSPYFHSATAAHWNVGRDPVVTLGDTKPEIFETYLHWVYTSEVDPDLVSAQSRLAEKVVHHRELAELWVFAGMVRDLELCNRLVDLTVDECSTTKVFSSAMTPQYIYENTSASSKLRKLHRDMLYNEASAAATVFGLAAPTELLAELATQYLRTIDGDLGPILERCVEVLPRGFLKELAEASFISRSKTAGSAFRQYRAALPNEFLRKIGMHFMSTTSSSVPKSSRTIVTSATCERYHEHADGNICPKKEL